MIRRLFRRHKKGELWYEYRHYRRERENGDPVREYLHGAWLQGKGFCQRKRIFEKEDRMSGSVDLIYQYRIPQNGDKRDAGSQKKQYPGCAGTYKQCDRTQGGIVRTLHSLSRFCLEW